MASLMQPLRLAVVTGAGSGLGRAFATQLAASGPWHVVAADLNEAAAAETLAVVRQCGGSGEVRPFCVTQQCEWETLRDDLRSRFARLDLLINNAGVCMAAEVGVGDARQWRRVTEVNYLGTLLGCHAMTPWLKESAAAPGTPPAVINVASIAAVLAPPAMAAYSAAKAAVVALSESMHGELRPHRVHVAVIMPGFFPSGLLEAGAFATPGMRRQAEKLTDSSGITAADVARAALAAAQRGKLYVTLGRRARWLARAKRLAPVTFSRLLGRRYAALELGRDECDPEHRNDSKTSSAS